MAAGIGNRQKAELFAFFSPRFTTRGLNHPGGAYLAKPDSAKSESAVQERAKPYLAKPGN